MEGMYTMRKLTLTNHAQSNTTVLENEFIDNYMAKANGEYVKVYLLLLRHLTEPSGTLTVSRIADLLEITEKDVVRALNYWKKQGLLEYESAPESGPASSSLPSDVPDIRQYRSRKEFKELLFVAEQYLGKTLSATDIEAITYFYETLHMSADLIEYLIEYCVENGHKSIHYIQKVALSWHEQEFHTVEEAKAGTQAYNRNCYSVLNAYGIKGRSPATSEIAYIRKWNEEYGFALEIILEACTRTMNKIHQPSFEYTDSILKSWLAQNVHSLKDVEALDTAYYKEKERKKRPAAKASSNKFNNFDSRSYDMNDLERKAGPAITIVRRFLWLFPILNTIYSCVSMNSGSWKTSSGFAGSARKPTSVIPALQQTEEEISSVSVAKAKNLLDGDETALASAKETLAGLFARKRAASCLTQGSRKITWNLTIPAPTAGTPATSAQRSATASRRLLSTCSISSPTCRGSWKRRIFPPSAWNITPATTLTR